MFISHYITVTCTHRLFRKSHYVNPINFSHINTIMFNCYTYFDQQTACGAPVRWAKYTTPNMILMTKYTVTGLNNAKIQDESKILIFHLFFTIKIKDHSHLSKKSAYHTSCLFCGQFSKSSNLSLELTYLFYKWSLVLLLLPFVR